MAYLKPQSPLQHRDGNYFYPLTTSDQIIMEDGSRLESLFKKTIKENITLLSSNWSETLPYTQIITLTESTDDYNVDANIAYGDGDNIALNKAAGCISYIKKNHKEITFYCLKSKPEVDIPIEITGTCRNTIATVEEGIKLNFDIKAYATEEELLADTPMENTIGVITDVPITGYRFSAAEPEDMVEGEVWIKTGSNSNVAFDIVNGTKMYPVSAKQYIDSIWVDKVAMSYQNNRWVRWIPEGALYYKGNEIIEKTGGWSASAWTPNSNYTNDGFVFEKNEDHMSLGYHPTTIGGRDWAISSNNKIDMSQYNTLRIDAEHSWKGTKIGLSSVKPTSSTTANWVVSQAFSSQTNRGETTLDVSGCDSSYYVVVWMYSDLAQDTYLNIHAIMAE